MKQKELLFIFSLLICFPTIAQRNYGQEVVDLLHAGNCFEARHIYQEYTDSMPKDTASKGFVSLYYKYKMASFYNKPDSSAMYLHQLLSKYESILGVSKSYFCNVLLGMLVQQQQYKKGIGVCDEIIDYLKRNPFKIADSIQLQSAIKGAEDIKVYLAECDQSTPRIKLVRDKTLRSKPIELYNDSTYIYFDVAYNGHRVKTWFDTGVSYYFCLEKQMADSIGVKYKASKDSLQLINNTKVRSLEGIVDSIRLGNIRLYNIPVMVLLDKFGAMIQDSLKNMPDKRAKANSTFQSAQILLGLPAMQLIEQFELNWKAMTLKLPEKSTRKQVLPNMYLDGNYVFTQVKINQIDYTSFLDTGYKGFIDIDSTFFEGNKKKLTIDSLSEKKPLGFAYTTHVYKNIPYEYLSENNHLAFDNKNVELRPKDVIIYRSRKTGTPNGVFGVHFFKRLGAKTILDFRNMRLDGIGKSIR